MIKRIPDAPTELIDPLSTLFWSKEAGRRVSAIDTLVKSRDARVLSALMVAATNVDNEELQKVVLKRIGDFGEEAVVVIPELVDVIRARSLYKAVPFSELRQATTPGAAAAEALKKIGPRAAIPLAQVVSDESASLLARLTAADGLVGMGDAGVDALPKLSDALQRPNERIQAAAVTIIGSWGKKGSDAVPALLDRLEDKSPMVQVKAAEALFAVDSANPGVLPALTQALQSDREDVRWQAATILGRIGPGAQPAVSALIEMFGDTNSDNRLAAVRALGRIGPVADAALMLLESLSVADSSKMVRDAAMDSIRKIRRK